jgi:MFS family permease
MTGGYISYRYGWANIFWVSVALSGICFIGVALFVPETLYERTGPDELIPSLETEGKEAHGTELEQTQSLSYKPYGLARTLRFGSPRGSLLQHTLSPWRTLVLPGSWVVMLQYAGLVGGIVTISTVGPQILAQPPYLWHENSGLINVGGLIGSVVGYFYTHLLSDSFLKRRAKRQRNGVAEAEDRLPTMFFPLTVATCGFFVFGFCARYPGHNRWVGLEAGYAMLAFGLMQVPSMGFNYVSCS